MEKVLYPTFDCVITNAAEEYDSGVWEFFRLLTIVQADIGSIMNVDTAWKDNYMELIQYLSDFSASILFKSKAPNSEFLDKMMIDGLENNDETDLILRSGNGIIASLIRTGAEIEGLMSMYIRLSRIPRFSDSFSLDKFSNLKRISQAVYSRAVMKSKE